MNHKVSEIERQEVKVQEEGVQVYGENYSLPSSTREVTMAGKRQGKNLAVTVINEVGSSLEIVKSMLVNYLGGDLYNIHGDW